ncbi:lysozyme-like isoform X1 [Macrosteles quadrilineatus]|uniref:lysozyme-like isoform X1 n=1 Tax=Macrosteles quadrilineatus TaxID=74068 RepID=UPI0023E2798B|nr:lysozyme-like isoform X1 [Macrosteles quadrilineatus]
MSSVYKLFFLLSCVACLSQSQFIRKLIKVSISWTNDCHISTSCSPCGPTQDIPTTNKPTEDPPISESLSDLCLGCICEIMSGCNLTRGCEEGDCGMFRITKLYWIDAGMPVLNGVNPHQPQAFESCARDPECAASTVKGYMSKCRNQDCNRDGRVDCMDYGVIHKVGCPKCLGQRDTYYETSLRNCLIQNS